MTTALLTALVILFAFLLGCFFTAPWRPSKGFDQLDAQESSPYGADGTYGG